MSEGGEFRLFFGASCGKYFYVSPFIDLDAEFDFRLGKCPLRRLSITRLY